MSNFLQFVQNVGSWINANGSVSSLFGILTGSVGALAIQRFLDKQELTIERSATVIAPGIQNDIQIVLSGADQSLAGYSSSSLIISDIVVKNSGRKDLKSAFKVKFWVQSGELLRCKPGKMSAGLTSCVPDFHVLKGQPITEYDFEIPPLRKKEFFQFQVYSEGTTYDDLRIVARPFDVVVKYRNFGDEPTFVLFDLNTAFITWVFVSLSFICAMYVSGTPMRVSDLLLAQLNSIIGIAVYYSSRLLLIYLRTNGSID